MFVVQELLQRVLCHRAIGIRTRTVDHYWLIAILRERNGLSPRAYVFWITRINVALVFVISLQLLIVILNALRLEVGALLFLRLLTLIKTTLVHVLLFRSGI